MRRCIGRSCLGGARAGTCVCGPLLLQPHAGGSAAQPHCAWVALPARQPLGRGLGAALCLCLGGPGAAQAPPPSAHLAVVLGQVARVARVLGEQRQQLRHRVVPRQGARGGEQHAQLGHLEARPGGEARRLELWGVWQVRRQRGDLQGPGRGGWGVRGVGVRVGVEWGGGQSLGSRPAAVLLPPGQRWRAAASWHPADPPACLPTHPPTHPPPTRPAFICRCTPCQSLRDCSSGPPLGNSCCSSAGQQPSSSSPTLEPSPAACCCSFCTAASPSWRLGFDRMRLRAATSPASGGTHALSNKRGHNTVLQHQCRSGSAAPAASQGLSARLTGVDHQAQVGHDVAHLHAVPQLLAADLQGPASQQSARSGPQSQAIGKQPAAASQRQSPLLCSIVHLAMAKASTPSSLQQPAAAIHRQSAGRRTTLYGSPAAASASANGRCVKLVRYRSATSDSATPERWCRSTCAAAAPTGASSRTPAARPVAQLVRGPACGAAARPRPCWLWRSSGPQA
jgi:hypothetical protein